MILLLHVLTRKFLCLYYFTSCSLVPVFWYVDSKTLYLHSQNVHFPITHIIAFCAINFSTISVIPASTKYLWFHLNALGFAPFLYDWLAFVFSLWVLWQVSHHLASIILFSDVWFFQVTVVCTKLHASMPWKDLTHRHTHTRTPIPYCVALSSVLHC